MTPLEAAQQFADKYKLNYGPVTAVEHMEKPEEARVIFQNGFRIHLVGKEAELIWAWEKPNE